MRFGGRRTSRTVESQRGQSFGGGGGFGGGGAMLLGMVFSRFGIGGVIVVFLILMFLGDPFGLTGGGQQTVAPHQAQQSQGAADDVC